MADEKTSSCCNIAIISNKLNLYLNVNIHKPNEIHSVCKFLFNLIKQKSEKIQYNKNLKTNYIRLQNLFLVFNKSRIHIAPHNEKKRKIPQLKIYRK